VQPLYSPVIFWSQNTLKILKSRKLSSPNNPLTTKNPHLQCKTTGKTGWKNKRNLSLL
jgi:hypothetical protein